MNKEQKTALVEEIAGQIQDSDAVFAVDYRGISVPQAAALRATLRDADATFRVVKNSLTERAADKAGADAIRALLDGPTALTFVRGDAALAAKALADFGRAAGVLEFKGGLMDGAEVSVDDIKAISRLPAPRRAPRPARRHDGGAPDRARRRAERADRRPRTPARPDRRAGTGEWRARTGRGAGRGRGRGRGQREEPAAEEAPAEGPSDPETSAEDGAETATEADAPAAAAENDDNAAEA